MKKNETIQEKIKKVFTNERLKALDQKVKDFLSTHPLTLAHGYSHLWETALNCQQLAGLRKQSNLDLAFTTGLLHDLYRPAEGGGLEEHEVETARRAEEILTILGWKKQERELITNVINSHDQRIIQGKSSNLDQVLSLADKQTMSFQRAIAYTWACNRNNSSWKTYCSFLKTYRDFCRYQIKAWEVFLALSQGQEIKQAAFAYMRTHLDLIQATRNELTKRWDYFEKEKELATLEARKEVKFLELTQTPRSQIKKIISNFSELL